MVDKGEDKTHLEVETWDHRLNGEVAIEFSSDDRNRGRFRPRHEFSNRRYFVFIVSFVVVMHFASEFKPLPFAK